MPRYKLLINLGSEINCSSQDRRSTMKKIPTLHLKLLISISSINNYSNSNNNNNIVTVTITTLTNYSTNFTPRRLMTFLLLAWSLWKPVRFRVAKISMIGTVINFLIPSCRIDLEDCFKGIARIWLRHFK